MTATWTIRDSKGELLAGYACGSRLEVARRIAPTGYDAFRLEVSSSYRELFERTVSQVLERQGWQIVRTRGRRTRHANGDLALAA